jgi:hypothetical protein
VNPRVQDVSTTDDYKLKLVFTNDETGVFDCSDLLDFGVFRELRDIDYFRQARVEYGTVTWPHEQDICPDTLYVDSEPHGHATKTELCATSCSVRGR